MGGLLVRVYVLLPLHCVRTPCRFGSCNRKRGRPGDCGQDQDGPGHDRHLLVHLPCCVLVPHVGHQRCILGGLHPIGLLRVRHHLQVRCRHCDLSDLQRQVCKVSSPCFSSRLELGCLCNFVQLFSSASAETFSCHLWLFSISLC